MIRLLDLLRARGELILLTLLSLAILATGFAGSWDGAW